MGTCRVCGRKGGLTSVTPCRLCGEPFCLNCGFQRLDDRGEDQVWVGVCKAEDPDVAGAAWGMWADVMAAWEKWEAAVPGGTSDSGLTFEGFRALVGVPPDQFDRGAAMSEVTRALGDTDRGHARRGIGYAEWRQKVDEVASSRPSDGTQPFEAAVRKLAVRSETAGRFENAAVLFELIDAHADAGRVRRKDRQVEVRSTKVDLNQLLQQVKAGGLVTVYKCPSCGAPLKIGAKTEASALHSCSHCGSSIHATDLAEFLRQVLE